MLLLTAACKQWLSVAPLVVRRPIPRALCVQLVATNTTKAATASTSLKRNKRRVAKVSRGSTSSNSSNKQKPVEKSTPSAKSKSRRRKVKPSPGGKEVAKFANNSKHQYGANHSRRRESEIWVPRAYRGIEATSSFDGDDSSPKLSADNKDEKRRIKKRREYEEKLANLLWRGVSDTASNYRVFFNQNPSPKIESDSTFPPGDKQDVMKHIKALLDNIHESEDLVDAEKLQQSAESYAALCRSLQHMCSISCSMSSLEKTRSRQIYIDIGEALLLELIQLSQSRMLLIDSAKHWANDSNSRGAGISTVPPPDNVTRKKSVVKDWLSNVVKTMLYPFGEISEKTNSSKTEYDASKEDAVDRSTQLLFRNVMQNIVRTTDQSKKTESTSESDQEGASIARTEDSSGQRLLDLLDMIPLTWTVESQVLKDVMLLLSNLGTQESARKCKVMFERQYSSESAMQFTYVLDAYFAAIRNEQATSPPNQVALLEEVIDTLLKYWDSAQASDENFSKRATQCSIVLDCIASITWGDTPGLCDKAESLAEKAIGKTMYSHLISQMHEDQPDVSTQVMPLLNSLALVFASSGQRSRVIDSSRILDAIIYQCHSNWLKVYPDAKTADVVLGSLADVYVREPCPAKDDGKKEGSSSITFAESLIEYMHSRGDRSAWPNYETYNSVFRLIDAIDPEDAAERTEDLLNKLEYRMIALRSQPSAEQRMRAHLRVLEKWCEASASRTNFSEQQPIPFVQASLLVEKMEIQSTPVILADSALPKLGIPFLYDTEIRPNRESYTLLLQACADTSNPQHHEKATACAIKTAEKMIRNEMVQECSQDVVMQLEKCVSKLSDESPQREQVNDLIASLKTEEPGEQEDANDGRVESVA